MPPQRDQLPPGTRRRRPDVMPGGWLWLLILLSIVGVLFFWLSSPKAVSIDYSSEFVGQLVKRQKEAKDDPPIIKKVVFVGTTNRLDGELARPASDISGLPEDLKQKLGSNTSFTTLVPSPDMQGDRSVTALLQEAKIPYLVQAEQGTWIGTVLMMLLPAIVLLVLFFLFLLPRFRDPLGGGFLNSYIKSPARRYDKNKGRV